MQRDAGIYKEAAAFIFFMLILAGLELAWLRAAPTPVAMYAHARATGTVMTSDILLKPTQKTKQSRKTASPAAKPAVKPSAPPMRDYRRELAGFFMMRGSDYPPASVTLIAVKDERRLEVWAAGADGSSRYIMAYPICAASGMYGPKLRRGDQQVPEGVYSIVGLNPYSSYHLSLKLDYPNEFDRRMAAADGRTDLGGNIFIHGDCRSAGCIAMGDEVIEELYALIRDMGMDKAKVIIAPWDLRKKSGSFVPAPGMPEWTPQLYEKIAVAMAPFKDRSTGIGLAMAEDTVRSN